MRCDGLLCPTTGCFFRSGPVRLLRCRGNGALRGPGLSLPPMTQTIEIKIDDRRRIQRQELRYQKTAHNADAEGCRSSEPAPCPRASGKPATIGLSATIHFINRLRLEDKLGDDPGAAVERATVLVGPALILTSVVLACGLVVTVFSNLPSLRLFGWLSAFTLILALIADLTILRPAITFMRILRLRAKERWFRAALASKQEQQLMLFQRLCNVTATSRTSEPLGIIVTLCQLPCVTKAKRAMKPPPLTVA
jgi:hypothetical protein